MPELSVVDPVVEDKDDNVPSAEEDRGQGLPPLQADKALTASNND